MMSSLDTDSLGHVFSFLEWQQVLKTRAVCRKWEEAAAITPVSSIRIQRRKEAAQLQVICKALPNAQSFVIDFGTSKTQNFEICFGGGYKYNKSAIDISPIRNLKNLRRLSLRHTNLTGTYPYLFQFSNLEHLDLTWNTRLKWDFELLAGLPNLVTLRCAHNRSLRGNLRDVQKHLPALKELALSHCTQFQGSMEDLYNHASLEKLDIDDTAVTGDIRTIGHNDLPSIKQLTIGSHVYGGGDMQYIKEAPELMMARYELLKRSPDIFRRQRRWRLAEDSPESYRVHCHRSRVPPFWVEFVNIAGRIGWRWTNTTQGGSCEIQWIDPKPKQEMLPLFRMSLREDRERHISFFRGFVKPPTEPEYTTRAREIPFDNVSARATMIPTQWAVW